MVLGLLAVEANRPVDSVVPGQGCSDRRRQWNSLVCGTEDDVEIATETVADGASVE